MKKSLNFLLFQLVWWTSVIGAAQRQPWLGACAAALIVAAHLKFAARASAEAKLIAATVVIGVIWDSLLVQLRWIAYKPMAWPEGMAPIWVFALWAALATTLNVSLNWLHGRYMLAACLGAIAGPLSYWSGAELGAATLVQPVFALTALAVGWALLTPLLLHIARYFDQHAITLWRQL